jgi:fructan beta-fructosidase
MSVALPKEHRVRFYGSPDLRRWEKLSDFGPAGWTGGDYECPDLVRVPVEDAPGDAKWVLFVSINPGAPLGGSAVQYFVGEFDGRRFVPDEASPATRWADHGKDFYAAQSWANLPASLERPVWIGWMSNWEYANTEPTDVWRGAMSVPRTLALRRVGRDWQLVQHPVAALESLREPLFFGGGSTIPAGAPVALGKVSSDTLDLEATFVSGKATEVGLLVRRGDAEETAIGYDSRAKTVFVDRTRSGRADFDKRFSGRHSAPVQAGLDGSVTLRVVVDRSSVEVFAGNGATVITDRIYPSADSRGTALFARGGAARLLELKAWRLRSAWRPQGSP